MSVNLVAICPTIERADLVRQLVGTWQKAWPDVKSRPPIFFLAMGQDDGTAGWLRHRRYPVATQAEVLPFAAAVNRLATSALQACPQAEWLLLLNNDLLLEPTLSEALATMAATGVDIIGGKLAYPAPPAVEGQPPAKQTIQHFGKWYTLDMFPFHVLRGQPVDHPESLRPRAFPGVTFALAAIKVEVWLSLQGLDEQFTNGYEDDDFCLRALEEGCKIGVHQAVVATHLESQTTGLDTANKEAQWKKFAAKWVDTGRIQWPLGIHQGWKFI